MTPNELPGFRTLPASRAAAEFSAEEMLGLLTRSVGATVAAVNRQQRVVYVNDEYARWFGAPASELVGKTLLELYGDYNHSRFMPFVERVLRGERLNYQRLVHNPEGFEEWRTICLAPWRNAQGEIDGFVTTALDVHELQVTMNALRAANQRLSSHMDNSPLAVLEMDHELRLLHCSRRAIQLMGWEDVVQVEARSLLALPGTAAMDENLTQALASLQSGRESQNRVETCFLRGDGTEMHCEWFNSALTDAEGRVTSIMSLVQDVSSKIEISRQQQYLANHDSLTGLYNRSAFHRRCERSLEAARHQAGTVALLFIDLDGFKKINDEQGHKVGDEVLRLVAKRLGNVVRAQDTVARLGGDEFLVMLDTDVDHGAPNSLGHRIIDALGQPMRVEGRDVRVGASIGVATYPPIEGDIEVLMVRADQAMYAAKRAGSGCVRYAEPPAERP
ncbi:diguanylate cyclase [Acidovorax sp. SUPP2522]|uniref:diguanylate cyclase domain-containing protein n=1 Tax=unclassified Acidovorax TaxID=2684926 RepID=UPI0023493AEF|nr:MULTISPECIES: diguanylate cyclase [unclassified Acidovorax]WCM96179.1 diguanylate cyclase [Acidovorax sp. GBBC 1281]GKT15381.1 diguanylate cyclase [Acidovorax sp. SUPP2522]